LKKIALVLLLALLTFAVACRKVNSGNGGGTPNPPFEGDAPQEAYTSQAEPGVYGGQMVMAIANDPSSFNIILVSDAPTAFITQTHLFRALVDYRNGGDPPDYDVGICTKWESSPDAKEWTFYLRKGLRWSDGQPFTADDVLFTYDVVKDEKVDNSLRDVFKEGTTEDKPIYPDLEKIDETTVRFKLHQPNGTFLDAAINLYPIPKHKWEQTWRSGNFNQAMALNSDPKDIIGLGPFRLKEYTAGQRVVLERNPYFWKVDKKGQRLPYLDRLIFIFTKDFNTITAKFQAGELDVMDRVRGEDFALVNVWSRRKSR
jgi:peptide/nickel transport system substrate-binding protein